ncbi:MAG: hypothetical protein KBT69_08190 [Oceanihabitans sp.]|nr:hypothetical protein [Oceanihabitans sp.]
MNNWKSDLKNWKKISKDTALFFLKQSEESLEETVNTFENYSNKTNQLLTISISLSTISLGYFFDYGETNLVLKIAALLLTILCFITILALHKNLFFDKIGVKGSQPKQIIKDKFFSNNLNSEEEYINIILNECDKYQDRIDLNKIVNGKRKKRIKTATKLLLFIPLTIILSKIITMFI